MLIKHSACNLINRLLKKINICIAKHCLYGKIKLESLPQN